MPVVDGMGGGMISYRLAAASSFSSSLRWCSIISTSSADTLARPPRVRARSKATRLSSSQRSAGKWTPVVLYGRSTGSGAAGFLCMND